MREELKIYVPERIKNFIKNFADERGLKMNTIVCMLLEDAIYMWIEEEREYGKIKSNEINS